MNAEELKTEIQFYRNSIKELIKEYKSERKNGELNLYSDRIKDLEELLK